MDLNDSIVARRKNSPCGDMTFFPRPEIGFRDASHITGSGHANRFMRGIPWHV